MKSCLLCGAALVFVCVLTFDTHVGTAVSDGTAGQIHGAFSSCSCHYDVDSICGDAPTCQAERYVVHGTSGFYKPATRACPVSNCTPKNWSGVAHCGC